jgi:Glyoxalase-like domain
MVPTSIYRTKSFADPGFWRKIWGFEGGLMPWRNSLLLHGSNRCRLSAAALALLFTTPAILISPIMQSSPLMAQESKTVVLELDHTSVCGSNLDSLRQAFTEVGLAPDFGGPHGNGITQMAAIGFDDGTYIELIAPVKAGATAGSPWARFMSDDAVTCAWATGTNVLQQEVDRLKKAGITATTPERGSRKRPDGMSVEWMTADVGPAPAGSVLPFMIEDETPRAWRVQTSASVQGAPVSGVENVVIGVDNLDASIALFRKAYGWAEPLTEAQKDWGKMAYFPGEPVILVAPAGGWVGEHVGKYGESPVAILLGARDFNGAVKKYRLGGTKTWFGQKVGWFDAGKLHGVRLGVIGQ